MKRIKHILIAAIVLVMVATFANADIPPAPADLNNNTGEYWVNYTWSEDTNHPDNENVTDSFNVSMNDVWYNGTATFLYESVGPGGWANITVWAYNATGNGNMSVGSVSGYVRVPAMADPYQYPIMRPDSETRREWIERYNAAPAIDISGEGVMAPDLPDNYSVLKHLDYNATERKQGSCGNCWMWAGTGCMEVAHNVSSDVFDRLSIQYPNSLYSSHCCGGWISDLVDFYSVNTTIAVPWDSTNASWQDGHITCGGSTTVPAASIATMPHYTITHIEERTITTFGDGIGQTEAIDNIKSVLANDSAIWFGFFLPTGADLSTFTNFWGTGSETKLWSPDDSCGHTWDGNGGGHAVLCVGYNDTDPNNRYWIMLNSWGTTANRPDGLFRMDMSINYSCCYNNSGTPEYSLYWQMLDIDFADICVNETGWWRDGSEFNENNTPIQAAVDAANQGATIHVAAGAYNENVNIKTSHLTLVGEGADVVTVTASSSNDHVFNVAADYVNISGFNVTGARWNAGIYLNGGQHCNISDNNASGNYCGIMLGEWIMGSNSVGNNTTLNNFGRMSPVLSNGTPDRGYGIMPDTGMKVVEGANNNILTDNTASNNCAGIVLVGSSNNTLTNNAMFGNDCNFGVYCYRLSDYTQNIDISNTVDGKPIYYYVGQQGGRIPTDAGYVGVVSSTNIIVRDLNLTKNLQGILFVNTSDSTIENVTTSNNICGIMLVDSSNNNTLTSNNASNNICGIMLGDWIIENVGNNNATLNNFGRMLPVSSNNTLTGNDASNNMVGIWLTESSNNTLTGNNASNNEVGIGLAESSNDNILMNNTANSNQYGIWLGSWWGMLQGASNDTLTGNDALNKGYGTVLDAEVYIADGTSNNTLTGNDASNNMVGIWLTESSNNTLTGNTANSNGVAPLDLPAGSPSSGIYIDHSSHNTLTGNTASDNSNHDIYITNSPSNTFADNTLNGTTVSFAYSGDVSLKGVGLPATGAPGWYSIGKFINAQSDGWMILNFSYSDVGSDSDFTGDMDESNLTVWKYNGTWYKDGWNGTRYSDSANKIVGVNITSFSVFAPMTTGVPALDHITVEPESALLNIDDPPKSQIFTATGRSKHTDPIPDLMFGWSNTDTAIGRLNNSAGTVVNFTAERAGRAYLTASNGSVKSGQVRVTVDGGTNNTSVTGGAATATSGDATVTCNLRGDVTGWINITAIGNATNSFEVNSSNPRYGLGDGDKGVSGVTVNVSDNILSELAAGNCTIRIRICYNATTLAALDIDASTLAIWKYNSTTEKWVKQPSTRSGTCIYVDVSHLCPQGLFGSKAATPPTPSGGSGGGGGTYPPGWFGTPTPTVTATKAPATATAAPPDERVTSTPTKTKPVAAKATTPAAEGTTTTKPAKGAPGFTAVFVIAGLLAVAHAMMRRKG